MENGKATSGSNPKGRPRVAIVGSSFAGFTCARELERRLRPEDAELVLASPTDYLLYSPLLPDVATGGHRFQGSCGGVSALKEHHLERSIDGD